MQYEEAVAEARQLVKRSEEDQWRLAELTWEQVEAGTTRRQWAQDIGTEERHVRVLHGTWTRWRDVHAADRPPFRQAYEMAQEGAATPEEARQQVDARGAASKMRKIAPEQRAAIVREALAEPEIAERVVRDTPTRARLAKAENAVEREREEIAKERYELTEPRSVQIGARADLGYALTKARTALEDAREAADKLAAYGWPDNSRDEAQVLGQRVHAALELYWATVRGEKLDEELRALVEGGDT